MKSLAHPAHPKSGSREARGLRLAQERFEEIHPVSPGVWSVPSCSGESTYLVRLRHESCTCPDYRRRSLPCKHVFAARVVKAKTAACENCGHRLRRRELVEVLEEDHLTWFGGELLCRPCADSTSVLY